MYAGGRLLFSVSDYTKRSTQHIYTTERRGNREVLILELVAAAARSLL
jgi:hypothetical protein